MTSSSAIGVTQACASIILAQIILDGSDNFGECAIRFLHKKCYLLSCLIIESLLK